MRRDFGLPEPEARIGRVAADFLLDACSAARTVFSRAEKRGGAPTVPARWLVRLETFLAGQKGEGFPDGLKLPISPAVAWAAQLDQPAKVQPWPRPAPKPRADQRPDRLSVTEVETLVADPYAFYARRVLKLSALNPLDAEVGAADYGMLVHDVLHRFVPRLAPWPGEAAAREIWAECLEASLHEGQVRPGFAAFWRPRLLRIGDFVLAEEAAARAGNAIQRSITEASGRLVLTHDDGRELTLTGRADRVDVLASGGLALFDYKTGKPPSRKQVEVGEKPQLPLEAAMLARGGFRGVPAEGGVERLVYWRLTGGPTPGEVPKLDLSPAEISAAADDATARLREVAERFLWGDAEFLARPHPGRKPAGEEYDHLSRLAEWSAADEEGEA
jgi:ATP-dependent helicase/nuclease subunit B